MLSPAHDIAFPNLPGISVISRIRGDHSEERWCIDRMLGLGATSRVYAATDRNLLREVAIKCLMSEDASDDREQFLNEARIAASLEHPNIIPVHELDLDAARRVFYAMKRVEGRSLGQEMSLPGRGKLASTNFLVSIFIDLLNALAYAHSRLVVHQDIKPDNIMLGDFGEVLLVDWGSAAQVDAGGRTVDHLYGTPLYMSPEQARREYAGPCSDIYAVGATLLHALIGRPPLWRDAPDAFWAAKRSGEIDLPTHDETGQVPLALVAIALQALAQDPDERYPNARSMLEDLERFQAGMAVSAHRDSLLVSIRRWYRRNRILAWVSMLAIAVVAVSCTFLLHERRLEQSSWHEVVRDDFTKAESPQQLATEWSLATKHDWGSATAFPPASDPGLLAIDHGELVLHPQAVADLSPRLPMLGDLRVEWTYRALDKNQNLNCFIGGQDRDHAYTFHIGGWSDPKRWMLSRGANGPVLAQWRDPVGVVLDRPYRFAMEKDGQRIRLWIDGRTIFDLLDYDEAEGLTQRGFGFDAIEQNRLAISDLVVYRKPLAQKVSPRVGGDELYRTGHFEPAPRRYEELVASYPGTELAAVALLRQGQCTARLGGADADGLLMRFIRENPQHALVPVAIYERWLLARKRGDVGAEDRLLETLGRHRGHPILCSVLHELAGDAQGRLAWSSNAGPLGLDPYPHDIDALARDGMKAIISLAQTYGLEVGCPGLESATIAILKSGSHPEWLLDLFHPGDEHYGETLVAIGRYDEVLEKFGHIPWLRGEAMFASGTHDEELLLHAKDWSWLTPRIMIERGDAAGAEATSGGTWLLGNVLLRTGQFEAAVSRLPSADGAHAEALLRLGRFQEVADGPDSGWAAVALAHLGRFDSAMVKATGSPDALYEIALLRGIAGQTRESDDLLAALASEQQAQRDEHLAFSYCLPAVLPVLTGRTRDVRPALAWLLHDCRWMHGQQVWYCAALIAGEIDEARFVSQPSRRLIQARLAFTRAVREDCLGHREAARDGYSSYLALPLCQRPDERCMDELASWRLRVLSAP